MCITNQCLCSSWLRRNSFNWNYLWFLFKTNPMYQLNYSQHSKGVISALSTPQSLLITHRTLCSLWNRNLSLNSRFFFLHQWRVFSNLCGQTWKEFGLVIWDFLQEVFNFETEESNLAAHEFCLHKLSKISLSKTMLHMCGKEKERLRGRLNNAYACC